MPEREFIRWLRERMTWNPSLVPIGPGDDAALVRTSSRGLLVAIDTIAENVDFTLDLASPRAIGRKALAVNLSDIAAMGGRPSWCLASVNLREGLGASFAKGLALGLLVAARKYDCPLIGGDLTGWKDGVVVTVAIAGIPVGKRAVTRSGARHGDLVFVTGSLGGSILGKHLTFSPRLQEAAWLARRFPPTAMIDLSDGLGVDSAHVAEESSVALTLDASRLPISGAARRLARSSRKPPLHHAVSDGEDFELLFTLPRRAAARIIHQWPFRTRLTCIGRVERGTGVTLLHADGSSERIDSEGYQHL